MNQRLFEQKLNELEKRIEVLEKQLAESKSSQSNAYSSDPDPLYAEAEELVKQHDAASASLLQRRLSIGYARAARILDQLEHKGVVGKGEGAQPRKVLMK